VNRIGPSRNPPMFGVLRDHVSVVTVTPGTSRDVEGSNSLRLGGNCSAQKHLFPFDVHLTNSRETVNRLSLPIKSNVTVPTEAPSGNVPVPARRLTRARWPESSPSVPPMLSICPPIQALGAILRAGGGKFIAMPAVRAENAPQSWVRIVLPAELRRDIVRQIPNASTQRRRLASQGPRWLRFIRSSQR